MARHPLNAKVTRNRHENVRERRDKPPLPAALVYFQVTDASLRQAASLSSLRQCGHRKTRISVSTLADTIAIRFISAVQRQSGSSVEPATSRRSNFDMTPPNADGRRLLRAVPVCRCQPAPFVEPRNATTPL